MRKTWKTFLFALIAIAALVGLDYGYRNYLHPRFGPPHEEQAEEEHAEEQPALILELTGQDYFAQFGNPNAPTKVVAYVPDHPCHNEAVRLLSEKAKKSPDELYVKLVRMRSAEAMQILQQEGKETCARYEINGQTSFSLPSPDGSSVEICFEKSPEAGGWTPDHLKMAVQQAIANPGQSVAQNRASTPGLPPQTGKMDTSQTGTTPAPQQPEGPFLLGQLLGDKPSGEWGEPAAPTRVVGYLPEACHGHEPCIRFLVDTAQKNPSQLRLRIVRMFTPEGEQITMKERGKVCAAYVINGKSTLTITLPAGRTQQVTFETSPETGAFTPEQLRMAVTQAMAKNAPKG